MNNTALVQILYLAAGQAGGGGGGADRCSREEPVKTLVPVIPAPRLCLECGGVGGGGGGQ